MGDFIEAREDKPALLTLNAMVNMQGLLSQSQPSEDLRHQQRDWLREGLHCPRDRCLSPQHGGVS